jgi:hypothetical protein
VPVRTRLRPSSIPVGPECIVFSSIISSITHACITYACIPPSPLISLWTSKVYFLLDVRISPHLQHSSHVHSTVLARLVARPFVTREARWYFQLPAPHPILISSLCSGPVCGRAWVSRLLPTSGHVAHGSVSSIDESRQPRVSSIAQSRLGLPSQTRVTVTHTSVPSPISMRGAAPEAFASGTERELTGSRCGEDTARPAPRSERARDSRGVRPLIGWVDRTRRL